METIWIAIDGVAISTRAGKLLELSPPGRDCISDHLPGCRYTNQVRALIPKVNQVTKVEHLRRLLRSGSSGGRGSAPSGLRAVLPCLGKRAEAARRLPSLQRQPQRLRGEQALGKLKRTLMTPMIQMTLSGNQLQ